MRGELAAVARIESLANEMFGYQEALAWMRKPTPLLGWQTPREALARPDGLRRVLEVLQAIQRGDAN